jgi:ribonuclease HI
VSIYASGHCRPSTASRYPCRGAYAFYLLHEKRLREFDGIKGDTSVFELELFAIVQALSRLKCRCGVTVFSRSAYPAGIYLEKRRSHAHAELWARFEELRRKHVVKMRWGKDPKWVSPADRDLMDQCSLRARRRMKEACRLSSNPPRPLGGAVGMKAR